MSAAALNFEIVYALNEAGAASNQDCVRQGTTIIMGMIDMESGTLLDGLVSTADITVIEAIQLIDKNAKGILYITDAEGRLEGSVTDGDVRRWILKDGNLLAPVSSMVFRNTKYLYEGSADGADRIMDLNKINSVPVLDSEHHIVRIIFDDDTRGRRIHENALSDTPIVIMAGGKGTRLHPFTKILPKPLIPIGEVPILERILNRFYEHGAREFYLTVNYKKEMIKSYLYEQKLPYRINYIEENEPLGTAGSIKLIHKNFDRPVMITNCDILLELDYGALLKHHSESKDDMTIVASLKNTRLPYGVLHPIEGGQIASMDEKPLVSHFINTGMYVLNPQFIEWIPSGRIYHMTDLADSMIKNNKQVGMYPISENSFLDMGEFEEMKHMEERISSGETV